MTGNSGGQRVAPEVLGHFLMVRLANELAEIFGRIVKPLFTRPSSGASESHALAALRDTLLPKLLSGEIGVKDAERAVQAAV